MTKTKITQYIAASKAGTFKEASIDAPELKPHDVLMEVEVCGVCHTDCLFMGVEGLNLGHEPVGKVVAKGAKVDKFEVGDPIGVSYLKWACGECRACFSGNDTMCEKRVLFPEGNLNGFASHLVADSRFAFKVPKSLDPKQVAVFMCAGVTVFNAIYSNKVLPTARVAIIGIGGLGHLAIQFAKAWGCHVTAISHSINKKEEALKFGAHDFLVDKEVKPESVEEDNKFDFIFDTVSQTIDYEIFYKLLKRNGNFTLIGIPAEPLTVKDPLAFIQNQLNVKGSVIGGRLAIELMLEFAARHKIQAQLEEYPFNLEGLEKAINVCHTGKARYRAVLVRK